jgi:histidyl-tRNA synthetase
MKISTKPVRGTRDILPQEMAVRDRLEQKILEIYKKHGYERVETPILENLNLLLGSEGGENLKMLFTILKRGEKLKLDREDLTVKDLCDIGLRYDLTLPLSRFYHQNQESLDIPFKAIQIGNVFRAERPQKGRFRSFKQCDIDVLGESSITAEIELIDTTAKALKAIGFRDFTVRINDRELLSQMITAAGFAEKEIGSICIIVDKLDKIGEDGVVGELVQKGYSEESSQVLLKTISSLTAEEIESHLPQCMEIGKGLNNIINNIKKLSDGAYNIEFDPTLVRGMGYYTGAIFEVIYGPYGFSIAGGGRYDKMIGKYGKQEVPAVGFSIGFERIVHILTEEKNSQVSEQKKIVLFYKEEDNMSDTIIYADQLREKGYTVKLAVAKKKLGKQINQYEAKDYDGFLVYGKDEEIKFFK